MATIINGKEVSAAVRAQVAQETAALKQRGIVPGLAVIIVGDVRVALFFIGFSPLFAKEKDPIGSFVTV